MNEVARILARDSRPLDPLATDQPSRLQPLVAIEAVLFDVYGTMVISGCGEVGTAAETGTQFAWREALERLGGVDTVGAEAGVAQLTQQIAQRHSQLRAAGVAYPEVDIVAIWQATFQALGLSLPPEAIADGREGWQRLAVQYEVLANPVWPMPDLLPCLATLSQAGRTLGIVSNAQFFTPCLFPAVVGQELAALGFADDLCFFSYQNGIAKPDAAMFLQARDRLAARGIPASAVLYVGNDMLNDMLPAQSVGFCTALFAGDRRSLRTRRGDPRVAHLRPDLVVASLSELLPCLIDEVHHG